MSPQGCNVSSQGRNMSPQGNALHCHRAQHITKISPEGCNIFTQRLNISLQRRKTSPQVYNISPHMCNLSPHWVPYVAPWAQYIATAACTTRRRSPATYDIPTHAQISGGGRTRCIWIVSGSAPHQNVISLTT